MFIEFYFNELFLLFVLKIGLYFRLGYLSDLFSNLRRDSLCDKKHFFMCLFGGHFFQKKKRKNSYFFHKNSEN